MRFVNAGLLLMSGYCNWRDMRAPDAKYCRWTVRSLTRRRAVVFILYTLITWALVALVIWIERSDWPADRSVYLGIPTWLGMQISLFRRTELYQFFGDADQFARQE